MKRLFTMAALLSASALSFANGALTDQHCYVQNGDGSYTFAHFFVPPTVALGNASDSITWMSPGSASGFGLMMFSIKEQGSGWSQFTNYNFDAYQPNANGNDPNRFKFTAAAGNGFNAFLPTFLEVGKDNEAYFDETEYFGNPPPANIPMGSFNITPTQLHGNTIVVTLTYVCSYGDQMVTSVKEFPMKVIAAGGGTAGVNANDAR